MIGCAFRVVWFGEPAKLAALVPLPAGIFELLELDRVRAEVTDGNVAAAGSAVERNGAARFCIGQRSPGVRSGER